MRGRFEKRERWKHVSVKDEVWAPTSGTGDGLLGFGVFPIAR